MGNPAANNYSEVTEDGIIAGFYRAANGQIDWREALDPLAQLTNS